MTNTVQTNASQASLEKVLNEEIKENKVSIIMNSSQAALEAPVNMTFDSG